LRPALAGRQVQPRRADGEDRGILQGFAGMIEHDEYDLALGVPSSYLFTNFALFLLRGVRIKKHLGKKIGSVLDTPLD
jgi:hypothetical protein